MKWSWDWMHVVLAVAVIAGTVTLIALGKGQVVLQVIAALSGGAGVGLLFKDSVRQPKEGP